MPCQLTQPPTPLPLLLLPRLCVSFCCCCCCCWLVLAWLGSACLKWQLVKFTQGSSTAHAYTIRQDTRGELCEAEAAVAQGGGGGWGWGRELAQLRKQQIKKQFDALSSSTKVGASLRSLSLPSPLSLSSAAPAADTLKLPISLRPHP